MEKKKSANPIVGANGDDVTTWALPEGATARLGRGSVRDMAFSPNGHYFAVGTAIGLWLYELPTLSPIALWDTERGMTDSVTFSPDNRRIVTPTFVGNLKLWDIERGVCTVEVDDHGRTDVTKPVFSKDGERLVVFSGPQAKVKKILSWCPRTGTLLSETEIPTIYHVYPTCFSPDLRLLAGTSYDTNNHPTAEFIAVDVASRRSYRPHGEKLPRISHNVYRSPNGKIISINQYGDNLNVREAGKSEPIVELIGPEGGLGRAKAFSPTGHRIASVDKNDNIHIWECTSTSDNTTEGDSWKKHTTVISDAEFIYGLRHSPAGLAFSPDGKRLASISRSRDWKAGLWDVDSGKQVAELPLSPPPRRNGLLIATYRGYDTGIAFSPRGDIIAGGKWGEIVLWDATEGKTLMTLPQPEESQRPITLGFSPCGQYLASGAWWQRGLQKVPIRLWKVETGENIATFWGHTTDVQCFAFSQDNTLLVSGGHDGAIYLWDLKPHL